MKTVIRKTDKIFVAGHQGMAGSAFLRLLKKKGYENLIFRTHAQLDLTQQSAVRKFFQKERPDIVIDAAAKTGGIQANSRVMADFFYENMAMEENLIWTSLQSGVKKFLFLGSACMYPKECPQPMKESSVLAGLPEPTNEGYALAKIAGARLCSYIYRQYGADFVSVIPANAYGPGDSFELERCHVIPALIRKCHEAKRDGLDKILLWGSGKPLREFIHIDDLADAGLFVLLHYSGEEPVNIGSGEEISISGLAEMIRNITGYQGKLVMDNTKPDGMMRRFCDSSKIQNMGWKSRISLSQGLSSLYEWYAGSEKQGSKALMRQTAVKEAGAFYGKD